MNESYEIVELHGFKDFLIILCKQENNYIVCCGYIDNPKIINSSDIERVYGDYPPHILKTDLSQRVDFIAQFINKNGKYFSFIAIRDLEEYKHIIKILEILYE